MEEEPQDVSKVEMAVCREESEECCSNKQKKRDVKFVRRIGNGMMTNEVCASREGVEECKQKLVEEFSNCQARIVALEAEIEGYSQQNTRLKR